MTDRSQKARPGREAEGAVLYRQATAGDVEPTYEVMLEANEDLNRRHGREVSLTEHSPSVRAVAVRRSGLRWDPDRFWVAEVRGSVVGFGLAIERPTYWYLAALHVRPAHQKRGIGRALIERCLGPTPDRARTRLTISEAINVASTGLYGQFGMFPSTPIVQLEGTPGHNRSEGLTLEAIVPGSRQTGLDRLDREVLGGPRPQDHSCWGSVSNMELFGVHERGRIAGYVYVDSAGAIGPAAVSRPALLRPAISAVLQMLAEREVPIARMRVPAVATSALAGLVSEGFRYDTGVNLFLTSRPFGRLDRYLFSGADALF